MLGTQNTIFPVVANFKDTGCTLAILILSFKMKKIQMKKRHRLCSDNLKLKWNFSHSGFIIHVYMGEKSQKSMSKK